MDGSEAREIHERLRSVYSDVEHMLDQQAFLTSGVHGLLDGQRARDRDVATLVSDMRWLKAGVFLLLLWQVGSSVLASAPAQAMVATVWP